MKAKGKFDQSLVQPLPISRQEVGGRGHSEIHRKRSRAWRTLSDGLKTLEQQGYRIVDAFFIPM